MMNGYHHHSQQQQVFIKCFVYQHNNNQHLQDTIIQADVVRPMNASIAIVVPSSNCALFSIEDQVLMMENNNYLQPPRLLQSRQTEQEPMDWQDNVDNEQYEPPAKKQRIAWM